MMSSPDKLTPSRLPTSGGAAERILVLGTDVLGQQIRAAVPTLGVLTVPHSLGAVWHAGRDRIDLIVMSITPEIDALRTLGALREVRPDARIIATCRPQLEPIAREAVQHGADEYLIEPLQQRELQSVLRATDRPRGSASSSVVTTGKDFALDRVMHLATSLVDHLDDGLPALLDRLATFLQTAFDAEGAVIEVDDHRATVGAAETLVLSAPIMRRSQRIGVIQLGPKRRGAYASGAALQLNDFAALVQATTDRGREFSELHELAWKDDLTGLYNRRYFRFAFDALIEQAERRQSRVTLLLFDVDDFKAYNDRYGHDTGDALLRELSELLERCSRVDDVVVRYGGDEFVVIFWDAEAPRVPGSTHPQDPLALGDRFKSAIERHQFQCLGQHAPGPVTISGGLACFPWHGRSGAELVTAADQALRAAKLGGKSRLRLAGPAIAPPPASHAADSANPFPVPAPEFESPQRDAADAPPTSSRPDPTA